MIYCPKCGTANRDGSRFCNECGQRLGAFTRVKCPECGAMNPVQHAFCAECGGRLLPSSAESSPSDATPAIKGLSLPTKSPLSGEEEAPDEEPAEIDDEAPAWLRELGARWTEGGAEAASSGESGEDIPDWLKDLRASLPDDQEEELPDEDEVPEWLAAMSPPASAAGNPGAHEAGGESDRPMQPRGPDLSGQEDEQDDVPDWLAEMRSPGTGAWAGGTPEEPETDLPQEAPDMEEGETPDWLAELRGAAGAEQPETESSGADLPQEAPDMEEGEVPDWLAELRGGAGAEMEESGAGWPESEGFEAEPAAEEEVPDWLAELRPSEAGASAAPEWEEPEEDVPPETPDVEEEQVPDWLAELRPSEAGASATPEWEEPEEDVPPETPDLEEGEVPDWLAEIRGEAGAAPQEPEMAEPGQAEAEEGEVPDWLAELRPQDAGAEWEESEKDLPPETPDIEEGEVPDWLAEIRGGAGAAPQEPEMAEPGQAGPAEAEEAEVPDWLAEMRPQDAGAAEPAEQEEEEASDWLAEMRISATPEWGEVDEERAEDQAPGEIPSAHEPQAEEGEVPDWLAELQGPAQDAEPQPGEPAPTDERGEEDEPLPTATMPGWLEELRPRGAGEQPGAAAPVEEGELPDWLVPAEGELEETLARAEIPEWLLALKPAELREEGEPKGPTPPVEEPVEQTGLLAGLQGTLPVEMIIAQPRAVTEAQEAEAPLAMDTPQAQLFAEIVGRPPQAAPKEIVQPQRRLLAMLPRWLIYIALIAVVTLPLLSEEPLLPRSLEAAAPVQALYDQIEALDAEAPVLVAFDYDPGTSDEMDVVAQVLVAHLMERQARIVAISLYPAGPPVAQALLDELAAGRPAYADAYGELYVNMGYLPGQATAVRLLGQSLPVALPQDFQRNLLADVPAVEGINNLRDFDLVLELAASEQSVRWWIEQAATPYGVPLAGGVSASVAPLSRPYYQTGTRQLVGLVGGLPDAATYQALRGGEGTTEGALAARLDALTGGHLVFILVLAIGSVVQLLRGSGGGR